MRIVFFILILFCTSLSHGYDFVDLRNSPLIISMKEKQWNLVTDKEYIPFLQFGSFYDDLNEPQLSIYLDTEEKKYGELYTYLSNDILIETQLELFRDHKNLTTEDKKNSFTALINSIFTLNKKNIQKISDLTKKTIGFTNQNNIIDHYYEGKFIEKNEILGNDKYCSVFYFWSEKNNADSYKIRVQSIICNLNIEAGSNPFFQDKKIESFAKNINFYNIEKFKDLYIDEATRLLQIKEQKELEEKKLQEEKRIAEEKARKKEQKQKEEKLKIQSALIKISEDIAIELTQLDKAIKEIKDENLRFNPDEPIRDLIDYSESNQGIIKSIEMQLKSIDDLINVYDGEKKDLINQYQNKYNDFELVNSLNKEYQDLYNEYLDNVEARRAWIKKDKKQKEEERKKKEQAELKKQQELEKAAKLKEETLKNIQGLLKEKTEVLEEINTVNQSLNNKLNLNKSESFVEEILITQENERQNLEDTFNDIIKRNKKINSKIDTLNQQNSYGELKNINSQIKDIETEFESIQKLFTNNNLILKNLILTNIELKQQEKESQNFIYFLLAAIIVLIIILIIVFIYFIRSGRKNTEQKTSSHQSDTTKMQSTKTTNELPTNENKSIIANEQKLPQVKKIEKIKNNDAVQKNTDTKEIVPEKEINSNDSIVEVIIKEYAEAFKNPKLLKEFTRKWKIGALDRTTSMSSNEDVVLEISKKIIDLANFWSIRDPNNDLILYILPGKVLWSRIGEILSDNSRFGYMNFNGIYELNEAKENSIKDISIGQKDESGKVTIIEKGSANVFRVI